jgi:3-dehydroquinate dehydratase type I
MNTINLCAVILGKTVDELVQQIAQQNNKTQLVEIRFDYVLMRNSNYMFLLKDATKKQQVIFTCRRRDEGGKWNGDEMERIQTLYRAFDVGFFVDVELKTLREARLRLTPPMQKKTIISFHDFEKTPSLGELRRICTQMDVHKCAIKKIATMVKNEADRTALYSLLTGKRKDEKLCVIGMGEMGEQTRILSPLLGGNHTYCTISSEGSAPGQLSCSEMKKIYRLLP